MAVYDHPGVWLKVRMVDAEVLEMMMQRFVTRSP